MLAGSVSIFFNAEMNSKKGFGAFFYYFRQAEVQTKTMNVQKLQAITWIDDCRLLYGYIVWKLWQIADDGNK